MAQPQIPQGTTPGATLAEAPARPGPTTPSVPLTRETVRCAELRAGGGDLRAVIANHDRVQADERCRSRAQQ